MMYLIALLACTDTTSDTAHPTSADLAARAYVVSEGSNELFVFDHTTLEVVGSVDTTVVANAVNGNHMAMVSADGSKVYVAAAETDSLVVIDAATLQVTGLISVGAHATHMALRPDSQELWVMGEGRNEVVVVDIESDTVTHRIAESRIQGPHFARFSGGYAYVPSVAGNQVAIVDLATYTVVDALVGDGLDAGACAGDPCGYADAQIDQNGVLFAANFSTGKVIVYDTVTGERGPDVLVGEQSWAAYVDPFADGESFALVPSWVDATVTRVGGDGVAASWGGGDQEVYGVNFSQQAPDEAFVLNRVKHEVSVLDRVNGAVVATLDVGGTTETGTTTLDGRLLLPISSTGEVVVIDTATHEELARFSDVGEYPWSVGTSAGQNYCH